MFGLFNGADLGKLGQLGGGQIGGILSNFQQQLGALGGQQRMQPLGMFNGPGGPIQPTQQPQQPQMQPVPFRPANGFMSYQAGSPPPMRMPGQPNTMFPLKSVLGS